MAKEIERRCGTCRFLRVGLNKAGNRIVRHDGTYLCTFKVEWPPLPSSITNKLAARREEMPTPWFMEAAFGTNCPVWEALKK
jgi:hypothetical protein